MDNNELKDINDSIDTLSKDNIHPWDKLLLDVFGENHEFPMLSSVEIPEDFDIETKKDDIVDIQNKLQQSVLNAVYSSPKLKVEDIYKSQFTNNIGKYDDKKYKGYINLIQMIASIPESVIDDDNSRKELTKKLMHEYVRVFSS